MASSERNVQPGRGKNGSANVSAPRRGERSDMAGPGSFNKGEVVTGRKTPGQGGGSNKNHGK